MRIFLKLILSICVGLQCVMPAASQQRQRDDVVQGEQEQATDDSWRQLLGESFSYRGDSAVLVLQDLLEKAQQKGDEEAQKGILIAMAFRYRNLSRYEDAIMAANKGIQLMEKQGDTLRLFALYRAIWFSYIDLDDKASTSFYRDKVIQLYESGYLQRKGPDSTLKKETLVYYNLLASRYRNDGNLDSAQYYNRMLYNYSVANNEGQWLGISAHNLSRYFINENNKQDSVLYYKRIAINASLKSNRNDNAGKYMIALAEYFQSLGLGDSAIWYAQSARTLSLRTERKILQLQASKALSDLYNLQGKKDSALFYINEWAALNDELFGQDKINRIQQLNIKERLRQEAEVQEALLQKEKTIANTKLYALLGVSILILALAVFYYRNSVQKKKANRELQRAYADLKSTQAQLIQSEKMASLGELTAGIAHEIQNPLNFVNNFSEVSSEMIAEIEEERSKNQEARDETLVSEILVDIKQNLEKINHHGKRADAIVKGMLQHSRSSSGQKEPTDINALCDEYLRLAYHGLKAKDQSFNASFHFEPDETLPKMNVVPQDIGRVLLNLINNAFYAVAEKSNSAGHDYQPAVSLSTKQKDNAIEIAVADNGNGIPDVLKEKIFQPFFTTKPTGQGTGLGLSLAYDIVKAHGGEIIVESEEGKGTAFKIKIPVS